MNKSSICSVRVERECLANLNLIDWFIINALNHSEKENDTSEVLLYSANGPSISPWIDDDFDVTVKGDNNFQDNESRTLNIHYNRNSLAWKCIWDGQLYYRVGDFSVQWQKDQYNVTMSFINTIDLDDVSQVRQNHFFYGKSYLI